MNLNKILNFIKKIPSSISSLIADVATGTVWILIKLSVYVYRFFKYVWYGLLWPFVFIYVLISKLKNKEVDVDKLRKESQSILEKEKRKEEKK